MKRKPFAIGVAIFCGALLILSTVFCFFVNDQMMIVTTALFGAFYVFYLVKLISALKKQKAGKAQQKVSPLAVRRR